MQTLDGRSVVVLTASGTPISIGRFQIITDEMINATRVELVFATEELSCRLRINPEKIPLIKQTWNGETFTYRLPTGDAAWGKPLSPDSSPTPTQR